MNWLIKCHVGRSCIPCGGFVGDRFSELLEFSTASRYSFVIRKRKERERQACDIRMRAVIGLILCVNLEGIFG